MEPLLLKAADVAELLRLGRIESICHVGRRRAAGRPDGAFGQGAARGARTLDRRAHMGHEHSKPG